MHSRVTRIMAHPPPPPPLHSIPYRLTWGSAAWRAGALPSRNSWPFLHITEKIKFPTDISFGSRKLELVEIDTRHAAERDVGVCPPLAHPHMHRPSCDECRKRGVRFSAKVAICTTKGGECNERSFICSSKRCVLRCPCRARALPSFAWRPRVPRSVVCMQECNGCGLFRRLIREEACLPANNEDNNVSEQ